MSGFDADYTRTADVFGAAPDDVLVLHQASIDRLRPALDLGVGQGRHALYLARQGVAVHGVDPSAVACAGVAEAARRDGLPVTTEVCAFADVRAPSGGFSAVLAFGLVPILTRDEIATLARAVPRWLGGRGHLWLTAFSTEDPAFARHAGAWERVGRNSFRDPGGDGLRTYLEPGEVLRWFARGGARVVHHWEGLGPEHRHGDGPLHRHGRVEVVLAWAP